MPGKVSGMQVREGGAEGGQILVCEKRGELVLPLVQSICKGLRP